MLGLVHLQIRGLMVMPPIGDQAEASRPFFQRTRRLQTFLSDRLPQTNWSELSMGTSTDYEVAVQEGATLVRVGTAIVGFEKIFQGNLMAQLVLAVQVVADVFTWVVIASVLLSYFVDPYNPIRQALDRIVNPFLAPIRRMMPTSMGGLDFSPMILILLVWLLSRLIVWLLLSL